MDTLISASKLSRTIDPEQLDFILERHKLSISHTETKLIGTCSCGWERASGIRNHSLMSCIATIYNDFGLHLRGSEFLK